MIRFFVDPSSVSAVTSHIEQLRERVLVGVRLGMRDAMQQLAEHTADNAPSQTGKLAERIRQSAQVTETPDQIVGTVRPPGFSAAITRWIERGVKQPAVDLAAKYAGIQAKLSAGKRISRTSQAFVEKRRVMIYDPRRTGQAQGFFTSHKAFTVPARPFLERSQEDFKANILDIIRARMEEAKTA